MSDKPQTGRYQKSESKIVFHQRELSPIISKTLHELPLQERLQTKRQLVEQAALEQIHQLIRNPDQPDLTQKVIEILKTTGFYIQEKDLTNVRLISHEISQPLEQLSKLKIDDLPIEVQQELQGLNPPEVQKPIPTAQPVQAPLPLTTEQRVETLQQTLHLTPQTAKDLGVIDRAVETLQKQIPDQFHPAAKAIVQGLKPENLLEIENKLRTTFEKVGLNPDNNIVVKTLTGAREQLEGFAHYHEDFVQAIQILRAPDLASGVINTATVNKALNLPKWLGIEIKTASVAEQAGVLKVTASFAPSGKLVNALKPLAKSAAAKLGKTSAGKAAAALTAKVATKLGIKATASTITAAIPGGQIIAAIMLVNTALDTLEAIPLVGKVVKFLRNMTPWRVAINGVKKYFSQFGKAKRELLEGNPVGILRYGLALTPVLIPTALFFGTTATIAVAATTTVVSFSSFIVPRVSVFTARTTASFQGGFLSKRFRQRLEYNLQLTRRARREKRKKQRRRLIFIFTIGTTIIVLLITVMLAGGAFMVEPRTVTELGSTITSSDYITLTKTANPTSLPNPSDGVTLSVNYNINIGARGHTLTNVLVENNTRILIPETGQTFPITLDSSGDPITVWNLVDPITGTSQEQISYTVELTSEFIEGLSNLIQIHDSILMDTVTVTVDVENANIAGEQISTTVMVRIGNPV
ncbi:hypothetical protein MUP65_02255, partial [Patescibacteria group bacterium]|nr:hypothetical protein [Patescibacteria group bacterium]